MATAKPERYVPRARRPASVTIHPRNITFEIGPKVRRHWVSGDPFLTHFMNALSVTFPPGEKMFMDAVKAVRDRVTDPETAADIKRFLAQEALHSREHGSLNEALDKMGYPARKLERLVAKNIARTSKFRSKKMSLAVTAALEHMTALMGHKLLTQKQLRDLSDPEVLPIWTWHAIEELEHKAVAFDTYQDVYGDYLPRVLSLVVQTFGLFGGAHFLQFLFLMEDGLAFDLKMWAQGLWKLWGPGGMLVDMVPMWLEYFRRDFHPWQQDDSALIHEFERGYVPATEGAKDGVYNVVMNGAV